MIFLSVKLVRIQVRCGSSYRWATPDELAKITDAQNGIVPMLGKMEVEAAGIRFTGDAHWKGTSTLVGCKIQIATAAGDPVWSFLTYEPNFSGVTANA